MIKVRRQKRIVSILRARGSFELIELAKEMPEVSLVTLRRDIAELASAGALERTHGGAVLPAGAQPPAEDFRPRLVASGGMASELETFDGVILPPVSGRGADALRRQIARMGIPFLAESADQAGGTYLGPDNRQAGFELGTVAAQSLPREGAVVLMLCQPDLANTRARAAGFEAGLKDASAGTPEIIRVNGQGAFRPALHAAMDAFNANPDISVVFGVNDHSALAGIEAAERTGTGVQVYATGGENPDFVGRLIEAGPLRALAAFFPDVVGTIGIDLIADALVGKPLPDVALTPHAILTSDNVTGFYTQDEQGNWRLRTEKRTAFTAERQASRQRGRIGFMPHYPAHDWYRVMSQAMAARAEEYGFEFRVSPPDKGIAEEISRLRAEIANTAVERIQMGQAVILGEGEATLCLAEALRRRAASAPDHLAGVTVITNALDVLFRLEGVSGIKVIMTSGEYQKADRCLVGPSLGSLFERMRADLCFLSAAGVSPEFGVSTVNERLALANSRFVQAARHTIVLADHTAIGAEANHRIARPGEVHHIITDDGALPADRQRLRAAGIDVFIAGEATDADPQDFPARKKTVREHKR